MMIMDGQKLRACIIASFAWDERMRKSENVTFFWVVESSPPPRTFLRQPLCVHISQSVGLERMMGNKSLYVDPIGRGKKMSG